MKKTATPAKKGAAKKPAKAPAKAPPKKPPAKKGAAGWTPVVLTTEEKKAKLEAVITAINEAGWKENKDRGPLIMRATEANCSYLLRRPTGILSLDINLAGGFPASAPSVIVGPDGVGKDFLLWQTCAHVQKIYGAAFSMAVFLTEFKPDKGQMRMAGLQVGYSEEEIVELQEARFHLGAPPLTEQEVKDLRRQIGDIVIISGVTAEEGFDALTTLLAANVCQIIAVNSIGFLQTQVKEETESYEDNPKQSSEAQLLSRVAPKFALTMNSLGTKNETAIFLVNQMRSKRDLQRPKPGKILQARDKLQPASQAMAMRHGMAIELTLHKGNVIWDDVEKKAMGRTVQWDLTKGKLGTHDGPKGSYDYNYDDGIDFVADIAATCVRHNVLEQSGAWYQYKHAKDSNVGFRVQGIEAVRYILRNQPEVAAAMRQDCLIAAGISYRYS